VKNSPLNYKQQSLSLKLTLRDGEEGCEQTQTITITCNKYNRIQTWKAMKMERKNKRKEQKLQMKQEKKEMKGVRDGITFTPVTVIIITP
jgi:hypothetical protein